MPDFKVHAPFEPTGDQPTAIAGLVDGVAIGAAAPGPARRHRHRQDVHGGQGHRGGEAPDAGHGAQQDARRAALPGVPGVLPGQRGRVLRQLLRLLPAGGLPAAVGHVHREGFVAQRRDRPAAPQRHARAVRAARRDHRRVGQLHLRPRRSGRLRRDRDQPQGRGPIPPRRRSSATSSTSSTSATTPPSPAPASGCAATSSRSSRRIGEYMVRVDFFGDEVERIVEVDDADRRGARRASRGELLPRAATTSRRATSCSPRSTTSTPRWRSGSHGLANEGRELEAARLRQRTDCSTSR